MPPILRIDVDKPFLRKKSFSKRTFLPSVKTLAKNISIAFPFSTGFLFGKKKKCMIKDLNSRGLKASIFFQPFTVQNKEFARELMKKGHSVGLHAVHTKVFKAFSRNARSV